MYAGRSTSFDNLLLAHVPTDLIWELSWWLRRLSQSFVSAAGTHLVIQGTGIYRRPAAVGRPIFRIMNIRSQIFSVVRFPT